MAPSCTQPPTVSRGIRTRGWEDAAGLLAASHTRPMSTLTTDLWGEADGPSRRRLLVDVATGAAFAVVVGLVQTRMGSWTWLAAVLLGAALAVRRVAPFVMVALAVAASL